MTIENGCFLATITPYIMILVNMGNHKMGHVFEVNAEWDDEASVFVATSNDIPGLVTEAETLIGLEQKLADRIPDLIILNNVPVAGDTVTVNVALRKRLTVNLESVS